MGGDADGLSAPIAQAVKCSDSNPPEPSGIGSLRSFEPPAEIALWPCGVHLRVDLLIISFLVHNQPVRARLHEGAILFGFHRPHFKREARHFLMQTAQAIRHIATRGKFGMLAGNQQEIAETLLSQGTGFAEYLVDG